MDKLEKALELLDKFFNENPKEFIEAKLEKIDKLEFEELTLKETVKE
jgi:hypothetical protein